MLTVELSGTCDTSAYKRRLRIICLHEPNARGRTISNRAKVSAWVGGSVRSLFPDRRGDRGGTDWMNGVGEGGYNTNEMCKMEAYSYLAAGIIVRC